MIRHDNFAGDGIIRAGDGYDAMIVRGTDTT